MRARLATRPLSASFAAFGGLATVAVTDPEALPDAEAAVLETVEAFDRACSRFREDSELSRLNVRAGEAVPAGDLLLDAVAASLRAAEATDGDVDPTIGQALIALGYDRDFDRLDGQAARTVRFVAAPGWRTVRLDHAARTIRLAHGVRLDLGATAKALAADRAAVLAAQRTQVGALVSLSGDIAVAGPAPLDGWRIRVTDDHRAEPSAPGQWITIESGGLATSSTTVRTWGDGAHHIVDPRTGVPARIVWRTVSVAAASCLDANIAATAAIVRGERAVAWLHSLGLPARLVDADGRALHVAGWPSDGDDE